MFKSEERQRDKTHQNSRSTQKQCTHNCVLLDSPSLHAMAQWWDRNITPRTILLHDPPSCPPSNDHPLSQPASTTLDHSQFYNSFHPNFHPAGPTLLSTYFNILQFNDFLSRATCHWGGQQIFNFTVTKCDKIDSASSLLSNMGTLPQKLEESVLQ